MKNGQPSRILDIRYFFQNNGSHYEEHGVAAYGRRMAWFLNGEGFSLGTYNSLYLCFLTSMKSGEVQVTDEGSDWWQCYTYVGVPKDFLDVKDANQIAMNGTVAALKAIRPDAANLIDKADKTVRQYAGDLRFLIKSKPYKRYILNVATTIAAHPEPSRLYASLTDKESGNFAELPPVPTDIYFQAFDDAASIRMSDIDVEVANQGELTAKWAKKIMHDWDGKESRGSGKQRPYYSKLFKRRV